MSPYKNIWSLLQPLKEGEVEPGSLLKQVFIIFIGLPPLKCSGEDGPLILIWWLFGTG